MKYLLNLIFPKVCEACNHALSDNEITLCTSCRHHLPVTNYHFSNEEAVKKFAFTPEEKYQKLREKNPVIDLLRQEFDLSI